MFNSNAAIIMIISLSMSLAPIFSVVFKTGGENRQNSVVIREVTLYMSLLQLRARSIFEVLFFSISTTVCYDFYGILHSWLVSLITGRYPEVPFEKYPAKVFMQFLRAEPQIFVFEIISERKRANKYFQVFITPLKITMHEQNCFKLFTSVR